MKRLTLVIALLALLSASTATAATPAKYRKTLNAICRAYTPKLMAAQDQMSLATKGQRKSHFEAGLRTYLKLEILQFDQVLRVDVPKGIAKQMNPALKTIKKLNPHLRSALAHSRAGNLAAERFQMRMIIRDSAPLNGQLDAAGLIDCGSNQP